MTPSQDQRYLAELLIWECREILDHTTDVDMFFAALVNRDLAEHFIKGEI